MSGQFAIEDVGVDPEEFANREYKVLEETLESGKPFVSFIHYMSLHLTVSRCISLYLNVSH